MWRYDRPTGRKGPWRINRPRYDAPAEDRPGPWLGKCCPDGGRRARDLYRPLPAARTPIPAVALAAGIGERNARRLLTALTAMTLLVRRWGQERTLPSTPPTSSASWSRTPNVLRRPLDPVHQTALGSLRKDERAAEGRPGEQAGCWTEFNVDDARRYHAATYLDRHGRRPPVQPPGRSPRPNADARPRRRLEFFNIRGDTRLTLACRRSCSTCPGRRGGARVYRGQRRRRARVSAIAGDFTESEFSPGHRRRGDGEQPAAVRTLS